MSDGLLRQIKSWNRAVAGAESVQVRAEALEELDEEVTEWRVLVGVEGQMLSVSKPAARADDWQIPVVMTTGVAEVAAEEHDRAVEQGASLLGRAFQFRKEFSEELHLLQFECHPLERKRPLRLDSVRQP